MSASAEIKPWRENMAYVYDTSNKALADVMQHADAEIAELRAALEVEHACCEKYIAERDAYRRERDEQTRRAENAEAAVAQPVGAVVANEQAAEVIEWLIGEGYMDWRNDGADESGHEDGFNSNADEAATLRHYVGKARAALAAQTAAPGVNAQLAQCRHCDRDVGEKHHGDCPLVAERFVSESAPQPVDGAAGVKAVDRAAAHRKALAMEGEAPHCIGPGFGVVAAYEPGRWFDARTIDEMQAFYLSRLPAIRTAAQEHGYAIGLHGSTRRDFDLMAMQWRADASDKDSLARAIADAACGIRREGAYDWEVKPSGRVATSIPICWTDHSNPDFDNMISAGHIDLSIIITAAPAPAAPVDLSDKEIVDLAEDIIFPYMTPDEQTCDRLTLKFARALLAAGGKGAPVDLHAIAAAIRGIEAVARGPAAGNNYYHRGHADARNKAAEIVLAAAKK